MNESPQGVPDDPGVAGGGRDEEKMAGRADSDGDEQMTEPTNDNDLSEQQQEEAEEESYIEEGEVVKASQDCTEASPERSDHGKERTNGIQGRNEDVSDGESQDNTPDAATSSRTTRADTCNEASVLPQRKFELLISSLKESSPARPLTTELQLVVELYEAAVMRNHLQEENERRGVNKTLTVKEKQRLLKLARVIMKTALRADEAWDAALDKVLLLVAQSKWHLAKALDNVTSNLEVSTTPVLHEWIKVVKGSKEAATVVATPATTTEVNFMFNPAKYNAEEQQRLLTVCLQQYDPAATQAGSHEDEWRIAEGIAEGDILCRTLPPILMKVLGAEGCFELQLTLHANVEGELKMKLDAEEVLHPTTERVLQLIGTAAASRQNSSKDLYTMLASIKTVHYEASTHTIVFTFFSRVAALRYGHVRVPFGRRLHTLQNTHVRVDAVHARKPLKTVQPHYHVRMRNLTRGMDLRRLYQWFKAKIPFTFEMVDVDTYSRHSRTSNTWELRFQIGHCPEYLRGKVRMIWLGEVIVLEHPRNKHDKQCLACGDPGHLARRCQQTPETLRQGAVVTINESEMAAMGNPNPAFKTLSELKNAIARRKEPVSTVPGAEAQPDSSRQQESAEKSKSTAANKNAQQSPIEKLSERVREDSWKTVANSAAAVTSSTTTQPRPQSGRKYWPTNEEVIDLLVSDEDDETEDDDSKTVLLTRQPTQYEETSRSTHLLANIAATRGTIATVVQEGACGRGEPFNMQPLGVKVDKETTFDVVEQSLGLRAMQTPATGNCQVLAVAQALLGVEYNQAPECVNELAKTIKTGVQQVASLNFGKEFPHETRARILLRKSRSEEKQQQPATINAGKKVTSRNSAKLFTKWLEEYASSPTDGVTLVPRNLWGNNDTLRMMTILLKKDIFVLGQDNNRNWKCTRYSCCVKTKNGATYQSAKEKPLDLPTWIQLLGRALTESETNSIEAPLVVRFLDEHHIAYSHFEQDQQQIDLKSIYPDSDEEMVETPEDETPFGVEAPSEDDQAMLQPVETRVLPESAREIKIILSKDDAAKKRLVDFFKITIPAMTDHEEERLGLLDGFDGAELMGFLQHHNVSEAKFQRWKIAGNTSNESTMGEQPLTMTTATSTGISDATSDLGTQLTKDHGRVQAGKGKRNHEPTPMKKKKVNGAVVNARNASVPLKKTRNEAKEELDIPRRLLQEFTEAELMSDSESGGEAEGTSITDKWEVLWDKKATEWMRRTKVRFPRTTDTDRQ